MARKHAFREACRREFDAAARSALADDLAWMRSTTWGDAKERARARAEVAAMPIEKVYEMLEIITAAVSDDAS